MKKNFTFPFLADTHALYLPDDLNFWTLATVALGSAFLFLVIVTVVIIYRTEPDTPLPVRTSPTVNHIPSPETQDEVKLLIPPTCKNGKLEQNCETKEAHMTGMIVNPEMLLNEQKLLTFVTTNVDNFTGETRIEMD